MFTSNTIRAARLSTRSTALPAVTRGYATNSTPPPPPAGQPAPNPEAQNKSDYTLLYGALGLAAAGGAYMYFQNSDETTGLKDKAKREEASIERRTQEALDSAKSRAGGVLNKGEEKFDQVKVEGREKLDAVRSAADARGRSISEDLEAKYDAAKDATRQGLTRARDSTENLYNEARSSADKKAAEARAEAEKKADQAKSGWFNWWGSTKSQAEAKGDELKRDAAGKVAGTAEDVRNKAEKHT